MHDPTALPIEQQELLCVLAAYHTAEYSGPARIQVVPVVATGDAEPSESPEAENDAGWIPRVREVPGIAAERLPPLHGQLIAHGLLRFNMLGRAAGVGYRITPEGRQLLASIRP
jgi:hypothetical protein